MKPFYSLFSLLLFLFVFTGMSHAADPLAKKATLKEGDYVPNTVIIKVKSHARSLCQIASFDEPKITQALARIGAGEVAKFFPRAMVPAMERNSLGKKYADLSLIYKIKYSGNVAVDDAIRFLQSTGVVEYAEPMFVQRTTFTPNDPSVASQYHIGKINAYNAWNVWQGDTNVVIGIVDSGTDWDHPDLVNNIKYNYADPIDGIDNDNDGFIDNFRGWDVSENDNNPSVGNQVHGSHVSGCAAASTNNAIGVAAPAFKCKFLPVKSSLDASTNSIDDGYDGIVYAVDHGCSVINCSWGRAGGFSQFEQDVIDYAAVNHDVLVVAAAGNDAVEADHWPASYNHVISVASTASNDAKSGFSNYGYQIDVCAPGSNIYATVSNNTYTPMSGTSMASPVAAGCAAMVRSRFPLFNADQAAQQLRNSCDNIYGLAANSIFNNKLGKGRVNLFTAVSDTLSPGVAVSNLRVTDGNDDAFVINDTLIIGALFTNLLRPTTNLSVTLSTTSTFVTILNNTFTIGALATLGADSNYLAPFQVKINSNAPANSSVVLKMTMTDGTYTDFYAFKVVVNVNYININVNDVSSSITSIGRIGYNTNGPGEGLGFTYLGSGTLLYEMGLMMGTGTTQVSDPVRAATGVWNTDFQSIQAVQKVIPGISAFDAYGVNRDNGATSSPPLNVLVQHRAYAWTSPGDRNYIMVSYSIKNTSANTLNNLWVGIFTDWDILPNYANNRSTVDMARRMGYSFSTDSGGYYAGVKLLSNGAGFNQYAIDNDGTGTGGMNIYDGYTDTEKYTSLSTTRSDAGVAGTGNDVSDVVSTGSFTILPNDSIEVAFALLAAHDLDTLQMGADAAQTMYDSITPTSIHEISLAQGFDLIQNFPNPAGSHSTISFNLTESNTTELVIFNTLGEKIKTVLKEKLGAGKYSIAVDLSSIPNGTYYYRLTSGAHSKSIPAIIIR